MAWLPIASVVLSAQLCTCISKLLALRGGKGEGKKKAAEMPEIVLNCCHACLQDDAAGTYKLADGVVIADERELRQLLRPEDWCGMESMTAGLLRLAAAGITRPERLAALPLDRLRLSLEQLSPPEVCTCLIANLCSVPLLC